MNDQWCHENDLCSNINFELGTSKFKFKQKCIPVGCVTLPAATVRLSIAATRCQHQSGCPVQLGTMSGSRGPVQWGTMSGSRGPVQWGPMSGSRGPVQLGPMSGSRGPVQWGPMSGSRGPVQWE